MEVSWERAGSVNSLRLKTPHLSVSKQTFPKANSFWQIHIRLNLITIGGQTDLRLRQKVRLGVCSVQPVHVRHVLGQRDTIDQSRENAALLFLERQTNKLIAERSPDLWLSAAAHYLGSWHEAQRSAHRQPKRSTPRRQ